MSWRRWIGRLSSARTRREQEIAREIRAHLDFAAEANRNGGMRAEDARLAAARAFGNPALINEDLRAIWGTPTLDALLQDLRYAMRSVRRAPGFAAVAAGSSALGIGACSLIFAIVNAALLRPLPVEQPARLMSVSEVDRRTGVGGGELSYPDFLDLRESQFFDDVAAYDPLVTASLGWRDDPERHWGTLATANYFSVVKPGFQIGRGFDPNRDDDRGAAPVVVLSHDVWRTRFGSDPGVVGRSVTINKRPATIVGVTAAGFHGTEPGFVSDFWIPFSMLDEIESRRGPVSRNRQRYWLGAVARLRAGRDASAARVELDLLARRLNAAHSRDEHRGFYIERAGQIDPGFRRMGLTLFAVAAGAAVLVLVLACVNVANLLLGRASARRREIAARMALGASRARVLRQLLTESMLLALVGGAAGWIIAVYGASLTGRIRTPFGWPLDLSVALDYRVVLFCAGLSAVTGLVFGLAPALRATKLDLVTDLKAEARGSVPSSRMRLRNGLVVAELAICTLLLVCMGLFLRSLQTARAMDVGVSNRDLLLLAFDPGLDRRSDPEARRLLRDVLDHARAIPGAESVTLTTDIPLTFIVNNSRFVPEEQAADRSRQRTRTDIYKVGPRFFTTLGIAFLAGDDFPPDQAAAEGLAIVNEAFARAAFADEPAIGRRIVGDGKRLQIIGVVATVKSRTIGEAPRPTVYLPILADYSAGQAPRGVTLVAKSRDRASHSVAALRDAIRRADPSLAVFDVRTMESHLRDALLVPRLAGALSTSAGAVGLAIALIGVYGVISFAVARRRREIGIRLAIGAKPGDVLRMILKQGIALALAGILLGLFAALSVTHLAASLLYGVNPRDAATFVAVPVALVTVALLACVLPARAAARLDPVDVLRSE